MIKSLIHLLLAFFTAELIGAYVFLVVLFAGAPTNFVWDVTIPERMAPAALAMLPLAVLFSLPSVIAIATLKVLLQPSRKWETPFPFLLAGAVCGLCTAYLFAPSGLMGPPLNVLTAGILGGAVSGWVYIAILRSRHLTRLLQNL